MSSQTSQKLRRMASPSTTKQGPMKATQSFGLMQGSPTASRSSNGRKGSPSSSPTQVWSSTESHRKARRSPDLRSSPERASPSSPCFKGKKNFALRKVAHSLGSSAIAVKMLLVGIPQSLLYVSPSVGVSVLLTA